MKKILILGVSVFTALNAMGQAQVENLEVVRHDGTAEISFDANIDKQATDRKDKLILTPVLYAGENEAQLAPIVVETRRTRILDLRNNVEPIEGAFLTENDGTVSYNATTTYADWLQGANLDFDLLSVGCCSEKQYDPVLIAQNIAVTDANALNIGGMNLIMDRNAAAPASAGTSDNGANAGGACDCGITFAQGSTKLDASIGNNGKVLDHLVKNLGTERSLVGKIQITGYASPEGELQANENLAKNRAYVVRNYLLDNVLWLRPSDFELINGGENWKGLYEAVEAAPMQGRWQVLDIIERTPADEDDYLSGKPRKSLLEELNGGEVWNDMLQTIFPNLRSVTAIKYQLDNATAQTATPAEQIGDQINQAIDLLGARDADGALEILNKVSDDARAWNPMGVAYVLKNDAEQAKTYFQKSADAGYTEAASNLKQME